MFRGKTVNKRQVEALEEAASKFEAHSQYVEAAENYMQVAAAYLDDNVLIYARYCHEAFRMWLKARRAEDALQQAQAAFRVLEDTGWLNKSMETVLDLKQMIDELEAAGYSAMADTFARELNAKLGELGLMLKPKAGMPMATVCPACGAPLPQSVAGSEIACPFCGHIVRAS